MNELSWRKVKRTILKMQCEECGGSGSFEIKPGTSKFQGSPELP